MSDTNLRYRPDIDGLRAFAVIIVILFHYWPGKNPNGFVGVDVFFVISGYLISGIILEKISINGFSYAEFYAKRFRRILPALIVVLIAALAAGKLLFLPSDMALLIKHVLGGAGFVSNLLLYNESGYFDRNIELKPLLHLWSLAVEEQFYLFWPFLLMVSTRRPLTISMIVFVSFVCNVVAVRSAHQSFAFYMLPTRLWELGIGYLVARYLPRYERNTLWSQLLSTLALGFFVLMFSFKIDQSHFPGFYAILPVLGAGLYISAGPGGWLNRALTLRPFVWVGLISYPLYLWHWVVLSFYKVIFYEEPASGIKRLLLGLSLLAAYLTYRLVEVPFKSLNVEGKVGLRKSVVAWSLSALVGVSALTQIARYLPEIHLRANSREASILNSYNLYAESNYRDGRCFLQPGFSFVPDDCFSSNRDQILFWGDSFSAQLWDAFSLEAKRLGVGFSAAGASNCLPAMGYVRVDRPKCLAFNNIMVEKIRLLKPKMVILFANWSPDAYSVDREFSEKLLRTVNEIKKLGVARVVVIGPTPTWGEPLHSILEKKLLSSLLGIPVRWKIPEHLFGAQIDGIFERQFSNIAGVKYISILKRLCDGEGCQIVLGTELASDLITFDNGHPTRTFANYILNVVRPILGPVSN